MKARASFLSIGKWNVVKKQTDNTAKGDNYGEIDQRGHSSNENDANEPVAQWARRVECGLHPDANT